MRAEVNQRNWSSVALQYKHFKWEGNCDDRSVYSHAMKFPYSFSVLSTITMISKAEESTDLTLRTHRVRRTRVFVILQY